MLAVQSLALIDKAYGENGRKILTDCVRAHCFLSINDPDTRLWASRLIGTRKVLKISNSKSYSQNESSSRSTTEERENVIEPEEFGLLPNKKKQIVYFRGQYTYADVAFHFEHKDDGKTYQPVDYSSRIEQK